MNLHIDNRIWSVVSTSGALVQGSYGHSSVWDPLTRRIYVYGGYQSESSSTYGLTNALYSYDTAQKVWRTHPSSGSYRYLHSAVMSGGLMLVYGGNTHNETAISNVIFFFLHLSFFLFFFLFFLYYFFTFIYFFFNFIYWINFLILNNPDFFIKCL